MGGVHSGVRIDSNDQAMPAPYVVGGCRLFSDLPRKAEFAAQAHRKARALRDNRDFDGPNPRKGIQLRLVLLKFIVDGRRNVPHGTILTGGRFCPHIRRYSMGWPSSACRSCSSASLAISTLVLI